MIPISDVIVPPAAACPVCNRIPSFVVVVPPVVSVSLSIFAPITVPNALVPCGLLLMLTPSVRVIVPVLCGVMVTIKPRILPDTGCVIELDWLRLRTLDDPVLVAPGLSVNVNRALLMSVVVVSVVLWLNNRGRVNVVPSSVAPDSPGQTPAPPPFTRVLAVKALDDPKTVPEVKQGIPPDVPAKSISNVPDVVTGDPVTVNIPDGDVLLTVSPTLVTVPVPPPPGLVGNP